MRIKSYFAATVESALSLARQELGADAMLVDSRRTGIEARHLGEYEVVCAVLTPKTATDEHAQDRDQALPNPAFRAPSLDKLSHEVSELKRYMERMAATIARSTSAMANVRSNPDLNSALSTLLASEVDSSMVHDILAVVAEHLEPGGNVGRLLAVHLKSLLSVEAVLGKPGARQPIVALVGPPGSGKTTSLVKLAALHGLYTRRPTQLLTLDTYRVAAAEQLRSYAAILGLGFQVVDTVSGLAQALEEYRYKDLVLIDTPGFGRNEMEDAEEIARFFATHSDIDTHLVLPVSMRAADLRKTAESYLAFRPSKLLFSKLDEASAFGSILNLVALTGKPVSFLSSGQQIPEDFAAADVGVLVDLILRKDTLDESLSRAVAAA